MAKVLNEEDDSKTTSDDSQTEDKPQVWKKRAIQAPDGSTLIFKRPTDGEIRYQNIDPKAFEELQKPKSFSENSAVDNL